MSKRRHTYLITAAICVAMVAGGALSAQEIPTVTIMTEANPDDDKLYARIEEGMAAAGTPVKIDLVALSSGYADAVSLRLLSGEIPDIVYFQGGDTEFANQGILEDLRPWIAETEHLKDALWPHNEERLENYPYLLYVQPARTKSPIIREDWLEELGKSAPTDLEEWTELLKAIAASDLDGNGANDTYGILAPDNTAELDAIFNRSFGIDATWTKDGDGNWINARVSDGERDKLAYYQMLFADGLLDPEFITTNWEVKEDKFYAGNVGVIMGTAGLVVDIYRTKLQAVHPEADIVLLDPPKGLQAVDVARESRGFAIHAMSDDKEAAMAVLDFLASPEGQLIDRMGFEGEHFTKDGDTYEVLPAMGNWYPRYWTVNPDYWKPPVDLLTPVAQASLAQGAESFVPDNAFVWPAELATAVDGAEQYYRSSVFRFVSGEWSMDQWDEYVAGWYANGGEAMTEYARSVLK